MTPDFTIPLSYNPIDAASLSAVLRRYDGLSPMQIVHDFETALKENTGCPNVTALNTGTAAIHLGLKALGVGADDYVIAPTFTYVASVSPVLYLNAKPVFVDAEAETWNMDPELVTEAVEDSLREGKKPKLILVVHTYGMPAAMNEILAIGEKYGIPVMEDAAEAYGSSWQGQALGTLGELGTISFNNNKLLTTYGGGATLTADPVKAGKILYWATHSRMPLPYYEHTEVGYNYRMGGLNAAAGLAGLATSVQNIANRRSAYERYHNGLKELPGIGWQNETAGSTSNRWFSCVLTHKFDDVRATLAQHRIETRPLWKPMHQQTLFKNCKTFLNGTADRLYKQGVCLPSSNSITKGQTDEVIRLISSRY